MLASITFTLGGFWGGLEERGVDRGEAVFRREVEILGGLCGCNYGARGSLRGLALRGVLRVGNVAVPRVSIVARLRGRIGTNALCSCLKNKRGRRDC